MQFLICYTCNLQVFAANIPAVYRLKAPESKNAEIGVEKTNIAFVNLLCGYIK